MVIRIGVARKLLSRVGKPELPKQIVALPTGREERSALLAV